MSIISISNAGGGGGGSGMAIGGTVTGGLAGSVLFVDTNGNLGQDNAHFYWDDANDKLGVGTSAPTGQLQVNSTAAGNIALIVKGASSQSGNLQQWRDSSNAILAYINIAGTFQSASFTASLPVKTNSSKELVTGAINLASADVTGVLPVGNIATNIKQSTIGVVLWANGYALSTGIAGDLTVDFNCTIQQVTMLADQSGSVVVDIWKDTYGNYPPTVADTITASAKPTISTATKSQDSTLTGWTTSITAGDTLRFNIDSVSTVTRVVLALKVLKT